MIKKLEDIDKRLKRLVRLVRKLKKQGKINLKKAR